MVILSFGSRLYGRQAAINQLQEVYRRVYSRDYCSNTSNSSHFPNDSSSISINNNNDYRREIVFISGEAGSGKTALARTLQATVVRDGGFFASGKFDPDDKSVFSETALPLVLALADWIHHIVLQQNSEVVDSIREAVSRELCEESLVFLSRIIPGLDSILPIATVDNSKKTNLENPKSSNPTLIMMANDSRESSKIILSKFIQAMRCSAVHAPLVLCLDDLQWSDDLTLDILHQVLTVESAFQHNNNSKNHAGCLLIVGTVRSDEVSPSLSRFMSSLETMSEPQQQHTNVASVHRTTTTTTISITNLTPEEIQEMTADVLHCSEETSRRVASRIHRQTKGNALFVRQALQSLLDDNDDDVILFHADQNKWEWKEEYHNNTETAKEKPMAATHHHQTSLDESSDFLTTMAYCMMQQEESVRYQLKVAACLGNRFPVDVWHAALAATYVVATNQPFALAGMTDPNLLVQLGYLVPREGTTVGTAAEAASVPTATPMQQLQWQHDCVWQAAYSLLSDQERPAWHVSIGRTLSETLSEHRIGEIIFLIMAQWSHGMTCLTDLQERIQVAELSLRAGEKAALSSSFQAAASCLNLGIRLLLRNYENTDGRVAAAAAASWKQHYDLCLALHNAAIEASFCIADFERMEEYIDSVLRYVKTYKDSLRARTMQIYSLESRGRYKEAYNTGIYSLRQLGIRFPSRDHPIYNAIDYLRTLRMLRGKKDRSLLSLPLMRDDNKLAAMSILFVFIMVCTSYRPGLLPLITTCMVRTTLKYGLCSASSQAFLSFGVYLLHVGQRREAFRFGQLALRVVESLNAKEFLPRCYAGLYIYINPFNRPLRDSLAPLEYAFRTGLETGDIDMAAKCLFSTCRLMMWAGRPLPEVKEATRKSFDFAMLYKLDGLTGVHILLLQLLDNFMVRTNDPLVLSGVFCNQDEAYRVAEETNNQYMKIYLPMARLWMSLFLNDYELAWKMAAESRLAIQQSKIAYYIVCLHRFLEGMAAVALSHHSTRCRYYTAAARRNLKEIKRFEQDSPCNCLNKVLLLEAELAARDGNMDIALAKFVRSSDVAAEEGFVHEQALACERAGIALRRCSDFLSAERHLVKARDVYQQWGAHVKVDQISRMYGLPELVLRE